jgi:hypothetical protein
MNNDNKLEKLQCTFPKLTEANQQYVLGLAEGLKQAQNGRPSQQSRGAKTTGRVKEG